MAGDEAPRPIIIKKKKGHAEAHGGAWKVAFADFMTAMFALFLVLWILTQSQEVKSAVESYFRHPMDFEGKPDSKFQGTDGLMQNLQGRMDNHATIISTRSSASEPEQGVPPQAASGGISRTAADVAALTRKVDDKPKLDTQTMDEVASFIKIADDIWNMLGMDPRYQTFKDNLLIQTLEEGLLIQLLDQKDSPLFEPGNARFSPRLKDLIHLLSEKLSAYPHNKLEIDGHCSELLPNYGAEKKWMASAFMAELTRAELVNGAEKSVREEQISKLGSCGDSRSLVTPEMAEHIRKNFPGEEKDANATAESSKAINRRITILLRPRQWRPERY